MTPYYRPYSGQWKRIQIPITKQNMKAGPDTIIDTPEGPGIKKYLVGIDPTHVAVLVPVGKATAVVTKEVYLVNEIVKK